MDSIFGLSERALMLHEQRSQLIANNLANIDTPNYKARDIDFKTVLANHLPNTAAKFLNLRQTIAGHQTDANASEASTGVKYRIPMQSSLDNNTVDSEIEQVQFTENAVRYSANLTFIGDRIRTLMLAIRGT